MIVYKVYSKDYFLKKGRLLGVLSERRNDLRGESYFESGLRWARLTFSQLIKDKHAIFVVPEELNLGIGTRWLLEPGELNREESRGMVKLVGV